MKTTVLPDAQGFPTPDWVRQTFAGTPTFQQIEGPARLVRLIQQAKVNREGETLDPSDPAGRFWFEERVLTQLRAQAARSLTQQSRTASQPFVRSIQSLISMYVMHCLRDDLAICKNWTEDFDGYVTLALAPKDAVVALVGRIKSQPYYSPTNSRGTPDPRYDLAAKEGVTLLAREDQYVIDFNAPANHAMKARISKQVTPL